MSPGGKNLHILKKGALETVIMAEKSRNSLQNACRPAQLTYIKVYPTFLNTNDW